MLRYILPGLLIFLLSCNVHDESSDKTLLARVYDQFLYLEDVEDVLPANATGRDSTMIIQNLINKWMQKQVILHKAGENLTPEELDFSHQLEEYRQSLVIYTYETKVVSQYLDTNVLDSEIRTYYNEHQQNFELKDNIVRINYVKIHQDSLQLNKFKRLIRSEKPDDLDELSDLSSLYASNYWIEDAWIYFSELKSIVPIVTDDPESFLRYRKNIEIEEAPYLHLLHIVDYKLIGSIAPLELEWDNIKKIIINNRKLELKNNMRKELMQAAVESNEIEVYQ